jgi:hypothetical protein
MSSQSSDIQPFKKPKVDDGLKSWSHAIIPAAVLTTKKPILPASAINNEFKNTVIPTVRRSKPFADKEKSHQFKVKSAIKTKMFSLFDAEQFTAEEIVNFLHEYEYNVGYVPQETIACGEAIKNQYDKLAQSEKRTLISLLTHRDGMLNQSVLDALPFLRQRSEELLQNPVRKVRSDKIDLDFISEFMHEHCR